VKELDASCTKAGLAARSKDESVVFLIPRRNIETWFAYLRGEQVNEYDSYPKYPFESTCSADVARLDAMCQQGKLDGDPPPSLARACDEYQRLKE